MTSLRGKTLFITGGSRGIGHAIALRAAKDGANVVIAAKTDRPHPRLPGTIHSAAEDVRKAGGQALPVVCDIRHEEQVQEAVQAAVDAFGGIDICINNASAISLQSTLDIPIRRFDLLHQVNTRGTFLVSRCCLPWLEKAQNPHILTLAPPLDLREKWFAPHLAYSLAKFGMSLCVLGMAAEFREQGIGVNALWPRTIIATAAVRNLLGGDEAIRRARKPRIVADAAHVILTRPSRDFTGNFCIDEALLKSTGVTELAAYAVDPTAEPVTDLFLDP